MDFIPSSSAVRELIINPSNNQESWLLICTGDYSNVLRINPLVMPTLAAPPNTVGCLPNL
ncbi:hypothetical protein PAXINDRAFT_18408 [Paxillus involutus ATCC 200175]|uniref:Uncharacterized protein n=1 Tax=Paxillus involutus ATCC 200175 TaxID=664439 RepID=A0A0C9TBL7_PAXIN|nr:hypothetical protein PAXINDRAFT_18408 [Paxillus involutus ATCC 200175]